MKKYLLLIVLFAITGCMTISYKPVANPDQRIIFEGFSFLPPNGENWEVTSDPLEINGTFETWGRSTIKMKGFKKSIIGPNQEVGEAEQWKVSISKYEFGVMKFDHDDDLIEFAQYGLKSLGKQGMLLLESSHSHETFQGMNCVRTEAKIEGGRKISSSKLSAVIIYTQGYTCVHPKFPEHLVTLGAERSVLKGQTPTEFQSEVDPFFNSLKVHEQ